MALPQPHANDTKERILAAAERLFRERGFAGTSLRSITAEAGVNVAALHYHFGGREPLARAVFERRIAPVNEERLRRLERLEADGGRPGVEALLRALVEPVFAAAQESPGLTELGALLVSERPGRHAEIVEDVFAEVLRRFRAAFARALPALPSHEVEDRLYFCIGAFVHLLAGAAPRRSDGSRLAADPAARERLVAFLTAGFAAPAARTETL